MNSYRKTAVIIGVLYIIGTAAGVAGLTTMTPLLDGPDYLTRIAGNRGVIILGALLTLTMGLALAMVPAAAYPVLKRFNQPLAMGYVIFRGGLETACYMGLAASRLLLVPLSLAAVNAPASGIPGLATSGAMLLAAHDWINILLIIVFALGALMLYANLYLSGLLPRWITAWGVIAILLHLATAFLAMFGLVEMLSPVVLVMNFPIFLQEMVMAAWLIARGFNPAALSQMAG